MNKSSTPLRESVRCYIDNYKWTFIISTIFIIFYIIINALGMPVYDFLIILFLGGIFSEILNKSKGFFHPFGVWVCIGLYQGVLFYVYTIGSCVVNKSFTGYSPIGDAFDRAVWMTLLVFGFTMMYILPANMVGGFVGFLAKRILILIRSYSR